MKFVIDFFVIRLDKVSYHVRFVWFEKSINIENISVSLFYDNFHVFPTHRNILWLGKIAKSLFIFIFLFFSFGLTAEERSVGKWYITSVTQSQSHEIDVTWLCSSCISSV